MTLELTDDEAALLLKELNDIIGGDRYSLSDPAPNPGNDPLQDQAPAAARPSTIAAEALRTAAGEFGEETRRRALMSGVRGIGSMAGANNSARPMPRFEPTAPACRWRWPQKPGLAQIGVERGRNILKLISVGRISVSV